jgi:hypothetical protein
MVAGDQKKLFSAGNGIFLIFCATVRDRFSTSRGGQNGNFTLASRLRL